ncbi:MAG: 1-acyl-sn-glycerol-3-phosphate acyltransferase [Bdellovibrionales bacterium]|nr:1-acyl-sn-glycerol-3-phosphate acyltransferase [Bdellovibrionales bacterium]
MKASEVSKVPPIGPRIVLKGLGLAIIIGVYFIECALGIFFIRGEFARRRYQIHAIARSSRRVCWLLGVRLHLEGNVPQGNPSSRKPAFVVSNHLSFLDVIALAPIWPSAFVTSVEVKLSGFLGWITQAGGCLFVERRNKDRLEEEKKEIAEVLRLGHSVFVFPESTSSDGVSVLPFKAALFDCAIASGRPIQPLTLRYTRINGIIPDPVLLDHVLYYGDHDFTSQMIKMLSLRRIEATVFFHPEASIQNGAERKMLANDTHSWIVDRYAKLGIS